MITSSFHRLVERTSDLSGTGGSLQVIPSHLAGSCQPSFTIPQACSFRTIFVIFASLADRHTLQIRLPHDSNLAKSLGPDELNLTSAHIASFSVCYTLVKLGYCIGLQKSILQPSQTVSYLGFECDSRLQAFRLLPSKKEKFTALIESIDLSSLTALQRLAGKCISMSMAVPGARIRTKSTWRSRGLPDHLDPSPCQSHCDMKLNIVFF